MKARLYRRHIGLHSLLRETELGTDPTPFHLQHGGYLDGVSYTEPSVDEDRLLAALPAGFLPMAPEEILLIIQDQDDSGNTAVGSPRLFRRWGKYFDAYVLEAALR